MTMVGKTLTLLILGAIIVLIITHPAGFATDATAGGSVLDNTLSLETGAGSTGGVAGSVQGTGYSAQLV